MKKRKFLLKTHKKHIQHYGLVSPPDYQQLAWDKMTEEIPENERYLKHFTHEEFEEKVEEYGMYEYREFLTGPPKEIPRGDLHVYLTVYTEPNGDIDKEKEIRIKYQDIIYQICNMIDRIKGSNITKGTGVTVDELIPELKALLIHSLSERKKP